MRVVSEELIRYQLKNNIVYILVFTGLLALSYISVVGGRYDHYQTQDLMMYQLKWGVSPYVHILPLIVGGIFSVLYSPNKSAWVNSLPYTRTQLYVNYFIAGAITLALPFIINGLVFGFVGWVNYDSAYGTPFYIIFDSVNFAFASIVLFSITSCIAIISGSTIAYALITVGVLIVVAGLSGAIVFMLEYATHGIAIGDINIPLMGELVYILDPETSMLRFGNIAAYAIIGIAAFMYGKYLMNKRSMEKTEEVIVFKDIEKVIQFVVSFGVSVYAGLGFASTVGGYTATAMYGSTLIIGLAVYIITTSMLKKEIRVWESLKRYSVFAVIIIGIYLVGVLDVNGKQFETPKLEEIANITIGFDLNEGLYGNYGITVDTDDFENALDFHDSLGENRAEWLHRGINGRRMNINYTLMDGTFENKAYYINEEGALNILDDLELLAQDMTEFDGEKATNFELNISTTSELRDDDEFNKRVLKAIQEDRTSMSREELLEGNVRVGTLSFMYEGSRYGYGIGDNFTNTLEVLKENGVYDYSYTKDMVHHGVSASIMEDVFRIPFDIDNEIVMDVYEKSSWIDLDGESVYINFLSEDGSRVSSGYVNISDLKELGIKF